MYDISTSHAYNDNQSIILERSSLTLHQSQACLMYCVYILGGSDSTFSSPRSGSLTLHHTQRRCVFCLHPVCTALQCPDVRPDFPPVTHFSCIYRGHLITTNEWLISASSKLVVCQHFNQRAPN